MLPEKIQWLRGVYGVDYSPKMIYYVYNKSRKMPLLVDLLDHIEIVNTLMPHTSKEEIENALVKAVQTNKYKIVKLLLSIPGIDVNSTKMLLLSNAIIGEKLDIIQLLLDHKANVNINSMPVLIASQNGRLEILKLLVNHQANINVFIEGYFPLYMLDSGVNIHQTIPDGSTALFATSAFGHVETTKLLIARNANINHKRSNGVTSLGVAVQESHPEIAKLLLDAQADPFSLTHGGFSYLTLSIWKNDIALLMMLLRVGLDINYLNFQGETPLSQAVFANHTKIVQLLLEEKAIINIGKCPINTEMIDLEIKHPGYYHTQKLQRLSDFYNQILRILPSDLSSLVVEYLEFTTPKEILSSRIIVSSFP